MIGTRIDKIARRPRSFYRSPRASRDESPNSRAVVVNRCSGISSCNWIPETSRTVTSSGPDENSSRVGM